MAISQKKAISEVEEEEYEDFEEMEIEEEVEEDDYEEAFEEEEEVFEQKEEDVEEDVEQIEEDEEEIEEQNEEEVKVEEEEEESVQESAMEEDETVNRKQKAESDVEQNEEEEEEIEPSEEDEEEIEENEEEEGKKVEEEESVQESAMEKVETVNRKQTAESDVEQNEQGMDDVKKVVKVEKVEEEEESVQESAKEEDKTLNRKQPPAGFLPLLQSVSDLEKLHCALSKFLFEWNSFSRSLQSITSAIDEHTSSHHDATFTEQEKNKKKDLHTEQEKQKEKRSCVEVFCEEMNGKALRKYIESNSNNIHRLRNEVPEALLRVPNPEKLVLDAIGKFYTQGRKACDNNTQLVLHRNASILLLEFFLLSGRPTGDSSVRVEANHGALLWWKRLVNENFETASVEDCLGLVLFLACFGISMVFASRDLCFLLLKSDLKKKINVLRRSSILVEKIPGIIKDLIRGEMYYEAAELSCFFELTDTFPPLPLLSSLVVRVIQAAKMERERSSAFPNLVRQADSWELTSLRSVVKFLEYHKFGKDSLDSVHIHKRISELESYINGDAAVLLNNIRKRKVRNHATARSKSRARSKKSFPPPPKTPQNLPSQMIQNNPEKELPSHPLLPENSALSAAVWERTYFGSPASYRSSLQNSPSQMTQKKPEIGFPPHLIFRNSDVENSAVSVAGWGRRAYLESPASYRSPATECSSAQQFYQRQVLGYGNGGGGFPGRDLYKFADTVEAQLSKSRRSSNTSPGGAKFSHY